MAYTVGWQNIVEGVDTGLSANAKIREAFVNTQTALNSLDNRAAILDTFISGYREFIFAGASLANDQQPSTINTELQLEFGAAQNDGTDKAMMGVDGTITFTVAGTYEIAFSAHFGRTGVAAASILAFRWLHNNVMHGTPLVAKIDNASTLIPWYSKTVIVVEAGDTLKGQIIRDSAGHDSGGLFKTTLNAAGWGDSPNASISVHKLV